VPGPFPGDEAAQHLRQQLRRDRSRGILDRIWQWATVQVGLPRSDFGKAVRYLLERWKGLTRFADWSILAHEYAIRLSTPARSRVALIGGSKPRPIAPDFATFLTLYLTHPASLFI
jgi:hypothetical protein